MPYISPGTFTKSPTPSSESAAILLPGVFGGPPVSACRLAFLFIEVLPFRLPPERSALPERLPYEGCWRRWRGVRRDIANVDKMCRDVCCGVASQTDTTRVAVGDRRINRLGSRPGWVNLGRNVNKIAGRLSRWRHSEQRRWGQSSGRHVFSLLVVKTNKSLRHEVSLGGSLSTNMDRPSTIATCMLLSLHVRRLLT